MSRRAFVIVLDACGAGELPDSADYGDAGADTLVHLAREAGGLELPVLGGLGLGSVLALDGVPPSGRPALHGRLRPLGFGKDSTSGHWELMGHVAQAPHRTYPRGFPPEVIDRIEAAAGRPVICNAAYNGVAAIRDYGLEQLATGALIVYTSADSVLQIAAHVDSVAPSELYAVCEAARAIMQGEHAVARVIARPFEGEPGSFVRTDGRRDYSLPPGRTYLDELRDAGVEVHAVGKVAQLFAGRGIDREHHAPRNALAIARVGELLRSLDAGLVMANLVDTDQVHGHRHDIEGFAAALSEIDAAVGMWLGLLRRGDLLVLTADHGCDPTAPHTDHTREHVPLLAVFDGGDGRRHDGPMADVGASALRWLSGREAPLPGDPFVA